MGSVVASITVKTANEITFCLLYNALYGTIADSNNCLGQNKLFSTSNRFSQKNYVGFMIGCLTV